MNRRARVSGTGRRDPSRGAVRIAVLGFIAALLGPLAISEAEAASFYTRKRVNGVWITGQFPKGGAASSSRRYRRVARAPVQAVDDEPEIVPLPPVPPAEGLVRAAVRGDGPETTAAIPRAVASLAEPFPEAPVTDERLARLKEALKAHATILVARTSEAEPAKAAAFSPIGAAEAAPSRPPELAPLPVPSAVAAAAPATPSALAPRSVSYDFETGIKTTVFENSVVREPFDVAAMKALTPRAPGR